MKKLAISIVTWNNAISIKKCIESVLNQTYSEFSLTIVDNNSFDDTCNIIKEFNDNRLNLIRLQKNTGFCGGHNLAISNTSSEYVLLVNPDIILSHDYIQLALDAMAKDEQIGTICGLLLQSSSNDPECRIDSAGMQFLRSGKMLLRNHSKRLKDTGLIREEVFGADGALPLYRRAMIDNISIGGQFFDELFFAHKEDWDVSWRAHLLGWKTVFEPGCVAIHPRSFKPGDLKLRKKIANEIKYHAVKNQLILLLKNEEPLHFIKNFFYIIPHQFLVLCYALLFERNSLKAYKFILTNLKQILFLRSEIQQKKMMRNVVK